MKRISACDRTVPFRGARVLVAAAAMVVFTAMMMLAVGAFAAKKKPNLAEMAEKAQEAVSYSLIGPFEMRADIKLAGPKGPLKGTFLLDWAAPDKFREEIHIPGYDQVKIASGTTLYLKRNLDYTPLYGFWVEELMNPQDLIAEFQREMSTTEPKAPAVASAAKATDPGAAGRASLFVDRFGKRECISLASLFHSQLCTDEKHGWPVSISLRNTADDETLQYGDYRQFGLTFVSRERQYLNEGRLFAEIDVKHLAKIANFPDDAFTPPTNAQRLDWCYDEIPAARLPLKPPVPAAADDFPNPEILDAFVNTDGVASRLEILSSSGAAADSAIRKLANDIRFTPATCGDRPIPSEQPLVISGLDFITPSASSVPLAGEGGYTHPDCVYCPQPQYSDPAFKKKIQGMVVLDVIILPNGRAGAVRIAKHLDPGLDESVVRTVRDVWRFKPALGPDGKPTAVRMLIEIDFHLY